MGILAVRLLVVAVVVAGCGFARGGGSGESDGTLTVFAAASLQRPLERMAASYESATGTQIVAATDSSAALRTQIEQGAPADVFLSADTANPGALVDAGLAEGPPVAFARNELVIVVPARNPAAIHEPAGLARPGVAIAAAGDNVPITRYATQLVERLAGLPSTPPGFADAYTGNVVSREDNVRAVLARVELGEVDAGIVYATDAQSSDAVRVLDLPAEARVSAEYAGVVVAGRPRQEEARAFLAWLTGPDGEAVLTDFGFEPPS